MKKYPIRDPKPDSWPWERARRAVNAVMRRVRWRLDNPHRTKFLIHLPPEEDK